uniref:Uncharacterized protein n=1 Tax=Timema poppense TaxID=170557 RepID=A0A7R9CR81_TIMPO|nr:unnamed protein product [Timema poppensis]
MVVALLGYVTVQKFPLRRLVVVERLCGVNPGGALYIVWDIRHLGGRAVGFTVDVSDRKEVLETARKVMLEVGHITMLVNNVGIYPVKPVIEWNLEELTELIHTNFFSHFWTLQAFLPNMIEMNKGHVVAISSAAAIAPVMNEVPYSASKSAVSGLLDGLLHELRQNSNNNIKITTVHPYYTCTRTDLPVKFDLRNMKCGELRSERGVLRADVWDRPRNWNWKGKGSFWCKVVWGSMR